MSSKGKVLVTGADGQLGSRLVRRLLSSGYDVRAAVLARRGGLGRAWQRMRSGIRRDRRAAPGPRIDPLRGLDIETMVGDLTNADFAAGAVTGVDAVLHTANFVRADAFENNVRATFNVAKACAARAGRLRRLVNVSSSSVYPNDPHVVACDYHPVDERHPCRPVGSYPVSKLTGEEIVWALARESGLAVTVVRPAYMVSGQSAIDVWTVDTVCSLLRKGASHPRSELYAPDAGATWETLRSQAASREQPCAVTDLEGQPWICQVVDPRDVAHGILCALESDAAVGETFNLSGPRPVAYSEAAAILANLTGVSALPYRAPVRWLFDLDSTKARKSIGYTPRWDIQDMLQDAVAFGRGETEALQ